MKSIRAIVLGCIASFSAACGNPGFFSGTYSGTLTSSAEPQLQAALTVIIGPSTGTPDMSVHLTPLPLIDCTFEANRTGSGSTAAMIPRGDCQVTTGRGQLSFSWASGLLTLSGSQLGLNLSGDLTAPYAPTSRATGDVVTFQFNGPLQQ